MDKSQRTLLLAAALLSSLVVCLPYLFMGKYFELPANQYAITGAGIVKVDELNYAARIREVYDGNMIPTDVQVAEHKKAPGLREILPIWVNGLLARFAGSMLFPFLLWDIVAPLLTVLLMFYFFRELTVSYFWSLAGSLILYFCFDPGALPAFNGNFFQQLFAISLDRPVIEMERLPSPQFHFPLLLGFFLALIRFYKRPESTVLPFVLGVLAGAMVYSYVYYAMLIAGILAVFFIYALLKRQTLVRGLVVAGAVAVALALPFAAMLLKAKSQIPISEILERFGVYEGYFLFRRLTLTYSLLAAAFLLVIKEKTFKDYLLSGILFLGLLFLNKQFFTGSNLHPMHWLIRVLHPFAIIGTLNAAAEISRGNSFISLSESMKKSLRVGAAALAVFALAVAFGRQWNYGILAQASAPDLKTEQEIYDRLAQVPGNLSVLTMNQTISKKTLILTPHDVYLPHYAGTLASNEEIRRRLFTVFWLWEYTPSELEIFLTRQDDFQVEWLRFLWGNEYVFETRRERQAKFKHTDEKLSRMHKSPQVYLPPAEILQWVREYQAFINQPDVVILGQFRLDYLVTDARWRQMQKSEGRISAYFTLLQTNEDFQLWEIKNF